MSRDKYFDWDLTKNDLLKREREVGFETVVLAIEEGGLLDVLANPNRSRYPHQRIFVVAIAGYAYLVPFIENSEKIFLKTIIPSRKATRQYIINKRKK